MPRLKVGNSVTESQGRVEGLGALEAVVDLEEAQVLLEEELVRKLVQLRLEEVLTARVGGELARRPPFILDDDRCKVL
jgi:hypothetical protein